MNYEGLANLTLEHLNTVMATVSSTAISLELMVHPGYPCIVEDGGCQVGPDGFSRDVCRQWELEILCSKELKDYWKEINAKVQSWEK